jgi:hypothetical protein
MHNNQTLRKEAPFGNNCRCIDAHADVWRVHPDTHWFGRRPTQAIVGNQKDRQ